MQLNDLSKEYENGRLLRLLIKLGFVVERPQGDVVSGMYHDWMPTRTMTTRYMNIGAPSCG